jgi:hypothetical protein
MTLGYDHFKYFSSSGQAMCFLVFLNGTGRPTWEYRLGHSLDQSLFSIEGPDVFSFQTRQLVCSVSNTSRVQNCNTANENTLLSSNVAQTVGVLANERPGRIMDIYIHVRTWKDRKHFTYFVYLTTFSQLYRVFIETSGSQRRRV